MTECYIRSTRIFYMFATHLRDREKYYLGPRLWNTVYRQHTTGDSTAKMNETETEATNSHRHRLLKFSKNETTYIVHAYM